MAACPNCKTRIPWKTTLKTTDVLLFPEEGAEQCPACHAKLVPTVKSVIFAVVLFLGLLAGCFIFMRFAIRGGFGSGLLAGLVAGSSVGLLGMVAAGTVLRFRTTLDDRYAYDRRRGLGI